jgi:hypothetical protein
MGVQQIQKVTVGSLSTPRILIVAATSRCILEGAVPHLLSTRSPIFSLLCDPWTV